MSCSKGEMIQDSQKTIVLFSPIATYPISFAAKAASLGKYEVIVVVPRELASQNGDHETCYLELLKDKNITVKEPTEPASSCAFAIFALFSASFYYSLSEYQSLLLWAKQAKLIGGLCHKWPTKPVPCFVSTIKYTRAYFNYVRRLSVIGFEEFPEVNFFSFYTRPTLTGIYAHPRYFHDETVANALNEPWDPRQIRSYKMNFLGTRAPESRGEILKQAEAWLASRPNIKIQSDIEQNETGHEIRVFWRPLYREDSHSRPPIEYLQILTSSDFTLCVPGYTVWSCRPPEAFLRGSIPILTQAEAADFHDCDLADMKNCIIVHENNWIEAMERSFSLSLGQMIEIRIRIWELRSRYFELSAWATRLREKLGL
jgi:hypothetical protein